ncbi:hypothetical protein D3C72_1443700 [compost metagenome]
MAQYGRLQQQRDGDCSEEVASDGVAELGQDSVGMLHQLEKIRDRDGQKNEAGKDAQGIRDLHAKAKRLGGQAPTQCKA